MFSPLKIIIALIFFTFANGEAINSKPVCVIKKLNIEEMFLSGSQQNVQTKTASVSTLKIKRKCRATESFTIYFLFKGINKPSFIEGNLFVNRYGNFLSQYGTTIQYKRGPPLV